MQARRRSGANRHAGRRAVEFVGLTGQRGDGQRERQAVGADGEVPLRGRAGRPRIRAQRKAGGAGFAARPRHLARPGNQRGRFGGGAKRDLRTEQG
jgi:hypothetical protein